MIDLREGLVVTDNRGQKWQVHYENGDYVMLELLENIGMELLSSTGVLVKQPRDYVTHWRVQSSNG